MLYNTYSTYMLMCYTQLPTMSNMMIITQQFLCVLPVLSIVDKLPEIVVIIAKKKKQMKRNWMTFFHCRLKK